MPQFPVLIRDAGGTTVVATSTARIIKPPKIERGKEFQTCEWNIECLNIEMFSGSNPGGTYDPLLYAMIVSTIPIIGVADGTFFMAERSEDSFKPYIGTDGEGAWTRMYNHSGKITFTLKQSSPTNDALSLLLKLDEITAPV